MSDDEEETKEECRHTIAANQFYLFLVCVHFITTIVDTRDIILLKELQVVRVFVEVQM